MQLVSKIKLPLVNVLTLALVVSVCLWLQLIEDIQALPQLEILDLEGSELTYGDVMLLLEVRQAGGGSI